MTTTTTNCTGAILDAIYFYGENCGLTVSIYNAYDAAEFVRDTHYEMYDEQIEIDLDELDQLFNIYSF